MNAHAFHLYVKIHAVFSGDIHFFVALIEIDLFNIFENVFFFCVFQLTFTQKFFPKIGIREEFLYFVISFFRAFTKTYKKIRNVIFHNVAK